MKKIIILVLALSWSQWSFAGANVTEGAANGGGGGTTTGQTVTVEQVLNFIEGNAKKIVLGWLNFERAFLRNQPENSPLRELYNSEVDVFSTVKNLKIEVETTKACLDSNGEEWDGSAHTRAGGDICISAKNVSEKTNHRTYRAETAALILHEVGHKIHIASHDTIIAIQNLMADDMYFVNWNEDPFSHVRNALYEGEFPGQFQRLFSYVDSILASPSQYSREHFDRVDKIYTRIMNRAGGVRGQYDLFVMDESMFDLTEAQIARNLIIDDYHNLNDPESLPGQRAMGEANLTRAFQGQSEITSAQYWLTLEIETAPIHQSIPLKYPENVDTIMWYLEQSREHYAAFKQYMIEFLAQEFEPIILE